MDKYKYYFDTYLNDWNNIFNKINQKSEIILSLPGVGKDNITVEEIGDDTVKITWKEKLCNNETFFDRVYNVIPHSGISAEYVDGILTITLVERPEDKPKKVEIK